MHIESRKEELMRRVALAAIAGAHGVTGEIRLKLFTDSADNLLRHRQLFVAGVERRLIAVRAGGKAVVARFEGIADRSSAEALRGTLVEVNRAALAPLQDGEYYHADLIGLPAIDRDGGLAGNVIGVENYGASDLLEIERPDGTRALIPFRPGIADLQDGKVVLDRAFLA